MSCPLVASDAGYHPAVFRIARIVKLKAYAHSYRSGKLTKAEQADIETCVKKNGIEFLVDQNEIGNVSLTQAGFRMYQTILHLRPEAVEKVPDPNISGNVILTFHCTRLQLSYYFFRFGKEAKILEPAELAQEFREGYDAAAERY